MLGLVQDKPALHAGAASGILDQTCARRSVRRQAGSKEWSFRSHQGMGGGNPATSEYSVTFRHEATRGITSGCRWTSVPVYTSKGGVAPSDAVVASGMEVGVAWPAVPRSGIVLKVRTDDSTFPSPLIGRLTETGEGQFVLYGSGPGGAGDSAAAGPCHIYDTTAVWRIERHKPSPRT